MKTNKFQFEAGNCLCLFWNVNLSWYIESWFCTFFETSNQQTVCYNTS